MALEFKRKLPRYRMLVGLLIVVPLNPTLAEDERLPEIIVTADYRQTGELDTASSISVLTEKVIKSRAAQHFEDIIDAIPNVNYSAGSNRARFFQIRGIGERSQFSAPLNSSVGLLIDNVDFSGAGTVATMMDVQQVEVLRGPQGTRYGANALAGLINIKTNDPTATYTASLKTSIADYNTQTFGAMISGAISEKVQGRLVAEQHRSDGYYQNDFSGSDKNNKRDELTLRGKLAIQPTEDWNLKLTATRTDIENGYDTFSLDNTRRTLSDDPGVDNQDSTSLSLESEWSLSRFDLVLLVNGADSVMEYSYDEDWTFTGFHPFGYSSKDSYLRDRKTYSAEMRLVSNESSRLLGNSTDWIVGAYLLSSSEDLRRQYTFLASDFQSEYDFDTYAAFFQLDSSLTDQLTLSSGLRLERRNTQYQDSEGVAFKPRENFWGGRVALKYYSDQNTMTYLSVARGYKAGGFNTDGTLDADLRQFDEEYLIEYELGVKSRLLDNQLQLRAAVFYDDRRDQQVKSSIVRVRPDGSSEFIDFTGNAAEGTNKGIEVELAWYITDSLRLDASVGLLDASFDKFINEFGEDLSGRDQAQAPSYTAHLALNYSRDNWFVQVSLDAKDSFYFSDRHAVRSKAYTLYHANIGYAADAWTISIWGKNLGDKDYYTRAFGSFGNDPRKNYITEPYFQFGPPRLVGMTFEVNL